MTTSYEKDSGQNPEPINSPDEKQKSLF